MSIHEQIQPTGGSADDGAADTSGQERVAGDVDDILDQIDTVLETDAAAFVQGFVQKGGQ